MEKAKNYIQKIHTYIHPHTDTRMHTHARTYTHIHTYIHTHTHTHIDIHIYTYTYSFIDPPSTQVRLNVEFITKRAKLPQAIKTINKLQNT